MQVHELMTEPPQTCPRTMHLADVSRRMRDSGCGSLIVLGARGRMVGIVTDRDIVLALGCIATPGASLSSGLCRIRCTCAGPTTM